MHWNLLHPLQAFCFQNELEWYKVNVLWFWRPHIPQCLFHHHVLPNFSSKSPCALWPAVILSPWLYSPFQFAGLNCAVLRTFSSTMLWGFFLGGDGGECLWVGLWVFCSVVMLAKYFLAYHNPFEITGSC